MGEAATQTKFKHRSLAPQQVYITLRHTPQYPPCAEHWVVDTVTGGVTMGVAVAGENVDDTIVEATVPDVPVHADERHRAFPSQQV